MFQRRVRNLQGHRVLITGAASGIGRATAMATGTEGAELYLTDVQGASLEAVVAQVTGAGGKVAFHAVADLAHHDQVIELAARVHAQVPSMDIVMNIAGISAWGAVERLEHRQWTNMIDVNLMGPINVIEAFVPPMITAGRGGYLVNVSSAAGLIGMPWHAAYSASKFGLRGVSEVLRFDLRQHRIGVSLVCPGAVATPLAQTVEIAGVNTSSEPFQKLQARFLRHAKSPEQAAQAILHGMKKGRYLVFTSLDIRLLHLLQRYAPPLYEVAMMIFNRVFLRRVQRATA
jgi:NAD(P)-dependent dehydrogenase (short-subunit alcohol dehydrogenase family)